MFKRFDTSGDGALDRNGKSTKKTKRKTKKKRKKNKKEKEKNQKKRQKKYFLMKKNQTHMNIFF